MGCDSDKPTQAPLKEFTSDFLTFQYPGYLYEKKQANGNVIFTANNLDPEESINNLSYYDLQELITLNAIRKIQSQPMDTKEFLQASIDDIKQLGKVEFITKGKTLKNGILVLEYILASPYTSLHLKQYFYCQQGDTYVVTISTPAENWSKVTEITNILERSLNFV